MPARMPFRAMALTSALLLAAAPAMAGPLQPPPGYLQPAGSKPGAASPCPAAPKPFTGTLAFQSKYEGSGKARDTLNPDAEKAYKAKTRPITAMEKGLVSRVKKYQRSGNAADLQCAVQWLSSWATAKDGAVTGAMLGEATNHTGKSLRKWSLGTFASAWVRLKFSASNGVAAYPEDRRRIERWLSAMADQVVTEWSPDDPIDKINNHYYWAAWALMATSVAVDRRDLFDRSLLLFRVFEKQIDADGYLPNEMKRATRAAGYHNYAMAPLAMIAAFAKANGVDLASEGVVGGRSALTRLAQLSETALDDPASFADKAGAEQDTATLDSSSSRAWLEPYCWTVRCTPREEATRDASRPLGSTRLGGDLTSIFVTAAAGAASGNPMHEEQP